jgi:predicted glutamine amidotransferase
MMAKASLKSVGILEELENCPYSLQWLSSHGRKSHDPEERGSHSDGCGLAYEDNGKIIVQKRGRDEFWDDSFHKEVENAQSRIFIAHDRDASSGLQTDVRGAHPFISKIKNTEVAFCHNGGVYSLMDEAAKLETADSELYLQQLLENCNDINADSIAYSIKQFAKKNTFSSITAFLMTTEKLFAWSMFSERDQNKIERYSKYYTLYISMRPGTILVSSEPLDEENNWMLLPNNSFIAIGPMEESFEIDFRMIEY